MNVLYANAIAIFKKQFAYRIPVIITVIGTIFSVYIQIVLWSYLYESSKKNMMYMIAYVCVSNFINCFYEPKIAKDIEHRFRTGDLALDLVRPAGISLNFWGQAIGLAASKILIRGLPAMLFLYFFYRNSMVLIKGENLIFFIIAIGISSIVYYSIFFTIGFLSFRVSAIWPYVRIVNDIIRFISGSVIPLALFPDIAQRLFSLMPFRMLYDFPINLLIGNIPNDKIYFNFILLVFWGIVGIFLIKIACNQLSKNLSIQGG